MSVKRPGSRLANLFNFRQYLAGKKASKTRHFLHQMLAEKH